MIKRIKSLRARGAQLFFHSSEPQEAEQRATREAIFPDAEVTSRSSVEIFGKQRLKSFLKHCYELQEFNPPAKKTSNAWNAFIIHTKKEKEKS